MAISFGDIRDQAYCLLNAAVRSMAEARHSAVRDRSLGSRDTARTVGNLRAVPRFEGISQACERVASPERPARQRRPASTPLILLAHCRFRAQG